MISETNEKEPENEKKVYDEKDADVHELKADGNVTSSLIENGFDEDAEEVEFDYTDFEEADGNKEKDLSLSDLGESDS